MLRPDPHEDALMKLYKISKKEFVGILKRAVHAAAKDGSEVCGLLVDHGAYIQLIQVRNKSRRSGSFSFYVEEIRSIRKESQRLGYKIVGTFHSHPAYIAKPGSSDIRFALDDSLMLVIDATAQRAGLWHIIGGVARRLRYRLTESDSFGRRKERG